MSSLKTTESNKTGLQNNATKPPLESPVDRQRKLLFSKQLSDVIFKVGTAGELINAHKVILSIASEVFYVQFNGGFADSERDGRENPVVIEDIEPATFKEVLRYIYCGEIYLTVGNVKDICYASKKYLLTTLSEKCKALFKNTIIESNVLRIFNENRHYQFDFVDELCLKLIRDNPLKCFRSKDFLELSQSALELIAAIRIMNCQKEQLCEAIEEWRKANDSTTLIQPQWESIKCRKLHSFGKFHYSRDVDTDITINVDQKLYLHGLGVFVGKSATSGQADALVTVTVDSNYSNVSVSKETHLKKDLFVEEFVFERLAVSRECRIKVTVHATPMKNYLSPPLFCLKKFQPIESEGIRRLTVKHHNSAKPAVVTYPDRQIEVVANCVAYFLFDIDD